MKVVLVPRAPVGFDALSSLAFAHRLPLRWCPPAAGGLQMLAVGDGERWLRLYTFLSQGTQLLLVDEDLAEAVGGPLEALPAEALLDEPSDDPLRAVSRVGLAGAVLQSGAGEEALRGRAREVLLDHLLSPLPLVRQLAGRLSWTLGDAAGLAAVERAAERYEDLAFAVEGLAAQLHEALAGTLYDLPTTDSLALASRALEAARQGQLERARRAATALLDDEPWNTTGLYALGVGLVEDNPLSAAFFLGAASSGANIEDEPDFPDAPDHVQALRERLLQRPATEAQQQEARALVLQNLGTWRRSASVGLVHGGAMAIDGLLPELQPLVLHLLGEWDGDLPKLERAAEMAPGVPFLTWRWLERLHGSDPERADEGMEALVQRLQQGVPSSPLDLELSAALEQKPLTAGAVLVRQAQHAYSAKRYDRALALADRAVALLPDDYTAHHVRALSFTFSERLEEALVAYTDTLWAMEAHFASSDALVLSDPRASVWFNRACTHAKLGRHAPALEDLRHAVGRDADFAEKAAEDDWFASLWGDGAFQAIVALEPDALVTAEHRRPEHALGLLVRAIDAENAGDTGQAAVLAQQAAQTARLAGAIPLQAEALGQWARTLALQGHLDEAARVAAEASACARHAEVPARVRGQVFAQQGVVSQAREDWGSARAAYEQSLAARRETGDPLLVAKSEISLSLLDLMEHNAASALERASGALPMLQEAVTREPLDPSVQDDLVSVWLRLAAAHQALGALPAALDALRSAVEQLVWGTSRGVVPLAGVIGATEQVAHALHSAGLPEAGALAARARALLSSGDAEVDRVQAIFRELRLAIVSWRRAGVDDASIASWIKEAALGRALLPEASGLPALAPLAGLWASACARQPTLLVTGALALELLAGKGQLDRSLGELEGLWASALLLDGRMPEP